MLDGRRRQAVRHGSVCPRQRTVIVPLMLAAVANTVVLYWFLGSDRSCADVVSAPGGPAAATASPGVHRDGHAQSGQLVAGGQLAAAAASPPGYRDAACTLSTQYVPSPYEVEWATQIKELEDDSKHWVTGCEALRADRSRARIAEWMRYWEARQSSTTTEAAAGQWSDDTFSYFVTHEVCGAGQAPREVAREPIEPLVGFLRHPLHLCFDITDKYNVDKDYMLMSFGERSGRKAGGQNYLFDAGASSYLDGLGGASQSWLVDEYRRRGVEFDRIFAWEARPDQAELISEHPPDLLVKLSYFAVPVDSDENGPHSVLRFARAVCKPEDFCVFKLDIDTPAVENAIVGQMVVDPHISDTIDEFYFEHHVNGNPMIHHGWGIGPHGYLLSDSYRIFGQLRELGVKAHSWV